MHTLSSTADDQASLRRVRYWQRSDEPRKWWPWGILLILAIILLWLIGATFVARHIESEIHEAVQQNLERNSYSGDVIDVSGQGVSATVTTIDTDPQHAYEVIRSTECETWIGRLVCPIEADVDVDVDAAAKADKPAEVVNAPAPAKPPIETIAAPPPDRFHDFEFTVENSRIHLSGEVANAGVKTNLLQTAEQRFTSVTEDLIISDESATQQWPMASDRALSILEHLQRGNASWRKGDFFVSGLVDQAKEADVRARYAATDNAPRLGTIDLEVTKTVDRCNQDFASALTANTVNFASGSAEISAASNAFLNDLAKLANQCPGELTVEGHTDNVGNAGFNQDLSQRRADAVSSALQALSVDGSRLSAIGFGMSQPVASNANAMGRAQNRRIAIKVSN